MSDGTAAAVSACIDGARFIVSSVGARAAVNTGVQVSLQDPAHFLAPRVEP